MLQTSWEKYQKRKENIDDTKTRVIMANYIGPLDNISQHDNTTLTML